MKEERESAGTEKESEALGENAPEVVREAAAESAPDPEIARGVVAGKLRGKLQKNVRALAAKIRKIKNLTKKIRTKPANKVGIHYDNGIFVINWKIY